MISRNTIFTPHLKNPGVSGFGRYPSRVPKTGVRARGSPEIPAIGVIPYGPGLCAISEESSDSGQVDPLANPFDTDGFVDDSDSDCSDDEGPELREANVIEKVLKKPSKRNSTHGSKKLS
ncbi:hypothetical protein PGT21_027206 [Puccinia graminis f. sp. tritici]|uniref:Uncharacterized protein n=1 Tax=Puccinia graminis f. sp. tritici TaxID=56615 RepID=A0A5B0LXE0_PUCGR|nr:hypothetical protein PGT21_027206 [Puccinia graminis f. sp. tritici]